MKRLQRVYWKKWASIDKVFVSMLNFTLTLSDFTDNYRYLCLKKALPRLFEKRAGQSL